MVIVRARLFTLSESEVQAWVAQPEWDSQSWLSGPRLKCVHTEALQHKPSKKPSHKWLLSGHGFLP